MSTDHKLDHTIKAGADDPVYHVHEYDIDLKSNHIYLFGAETYMAGQDTDSAGEPGVEYVMANRFIRNLNLCMRVNPGKAILIHMKTCGGDWTEGMAIYNTIKSCPVPVTILNYTHARSMSSLIFLAANKRVMMPDSYFLFHEGTLAYQGVYKEVMSQVEFDKLGRERMVDIYVDAMKESGNMSKKSKAVIRTWVEDKMDKKSDVFFTEKSAVEHGFADEVFDYNWSKLTDYTDAQLARG